MFHLGCAGITFKGQVQLVAFCVFEFAVGLFWPSMMKMRSQHVPEEMRATVINLFRVPLNLFVCIVLYNVSPFDPCLVASYKPILDQASNAQVTCQSLLLDWPPT